jgi:RNA polymerase sigma factor (sigma-70 family)
VPSAITTQAFRQHSDRRADPGGVLGKGNKVETGGIQELTPGILAFQDVAGMTRKQPEQVVEEARRLKMEGQVAASQKLLGALFVEYEPVLRRIAIPLAHHGSQSVEDLIQVGYATALRYIDSFKIGKVTFVSWLRLNANRDMVRAQQNHGADVHVSDGARHGKTRNESTEISVESRDAKVETTEETPRRKAARSYEVNTVTAEDLFSDAEVAARVRAAVARLEQPHRNVISRVYGIGFEETSALQLSQLTGVPKTRISKILQEAQAQLFDLLDEGDA